MGPRTALAVLLAAVPIAAAQIQAPPPGRVPHEPPPAHRKPPFLAPAAVQTSPAARVRRALFESIQVNTDANGLNIVGDAANESTIAPNELDPDNLVIGWRQFDTIASDFRQAGQAFSFDHGQTWSARTLTPGTFRSDPVVRAGPDGEFNYSTHRREPPYETDNIRTEDGGETWAGPFYSLGGDKQWISVDLTDGPGRGMLYQHWDNASPFGRKFARSFDRGSAWDGPFNGSSDWGQEATLPDGSVCITNGNRTTSTVIHLVNTADPDHPPIVASTTTTPLRLGGFSSLQSINRGGLIGQGKVSADHSDGPTHGYIYVLGTGDYDDSDGIDYNIGFARSIDNNLSYSGVTFPHAVTTGHQWFGTMSVAPGGRIDVVWNDTRNDPVDPWNPDTSELFYTCSLDAGQTWLPEIPVSPPFEHAIGYPQQNKLGDYYDAHSDDLGMDVAYAATFTGGQDVYYLRIGTADCNHNGIPDEPEIAMGLAIDDNADGVIDDCACIADFNADGTVDTQDFLAFLNAWATERLEDCSAGDCLTDLDHNGVVDTQDFLAFLNAWAVGC